ncbi:MAG: hypothetical protein ACRED0_08575 [Gammaproteobacteria bacterium]
MWVASDASHVVLPVCTLAPRQTRSLLAPNRDYGSETVYLLDGEEANEIIDSLENYPCLDEELVSEVEDEWYKEAWRCWLRSDLIHSIADEELREYAEASS